MKNKTLSLALTTTLLTGTFVLSNQLTASAFTWNLSTTSGAGAITGNFTLNDETTGTITGINISVGGVPTFSNTDIGTSFVITFGVGGSNNITFLNGGGDNLSLTFLSNLTTAGGTATIDPINSTFDNGTNFPVNGSATTNSVTGSVPFDFSTTPGLIVIGLISGANYAYKKWQNKKDNKRDNKRVQSPGKLG